MDPKNLLLVENDEDLSEVMQRILGTNGYRVVAVSAAKDALAAAANENFDLVITDMTLPLMSGLELADRLRETKPDLRVLYMSADQDRLPEDARHTLMKPFRRETLMKKVREALDS